MKHLNFLNIFFVILIIILAAIIFNNQNQKNEGVQSPLKRIIGQVMTPTPTAIPIPAKKIINNNYHVFQSFNNCGPASLSMALSYFGINKTQEELGADLRPYQNTIGNNDDKSVTLEELAKKAREYDLTAYHRPNGSIEMMKKFIDRDIPVITRTWLNPDEDIGHYRVIKGYDDSTKTIVQDDSYQGKNLEYSYDEFNMIWEKFNYEYLVLVPKNKNEIAKEILGEDMDFKTAWENAARNAAKQLKSNNDDVYARFNLAVAYFNTGKFEESVNEYEKIEHQLPWRTLWYQTEPIKAYFKLGNYDKVLTLTNSILNNENRAFSELYILRGKIFQKQKRFELARMEFENAVMYNQNLKDAQAALNNLLQRQSQG